MLQFPWLDLYGTNLTQEETGKESLLSALAEETEIDLNALYFVFSFVFQFFLWGAGLMKYVDVMEYMPLGEFKCKALAVVLVITQAY
jgi:hypothetical protein